MEQTKNEKLEKIIWKDSFSVQHGRLDRQHKKIIQLINQMIDRHNEKVDSEFISETLTSIREYSEQHLAFEEDLLEKCHYNDLEKHKTLHQDYRKTVVRFCMDVMNSHTSTPTEILTFLNKWWTYHILHCDHQYIPFIPHDETV